MASNNQIVKKSIQIDATDTLRTVKALKQEIADLRDELLNLEQGTEEYDEVQKKLTDDVNDLNTVMGAHKEKAEALEGSYNDLQNQLKELRTAWKETNDEAERDVLGQKINELNDQLKTMDASIGDFHRNVGNYQSAWDGLSGTMERNEKIVDDLEKGVKAFGTAMGLSDKQVNTLSKSLKAMKDGFKIAKDITKAQQATQQFAAAETKAATAGTTLATSQTAAGAAATTMAVGETTAAAATNGLSVAMTGLKAALMSTGIGAIIVLLGTLASQLDVVMGKIHKHSDEAFTEMSVWNQLWANNLNNKIDSLKNDEQILDHELKMNEARGKSERELLEQRKQNYEELYKMADDLYGQVLEKHDEYLREVNAMTDKEKKRNKDTIDETLEMYQNALNDAKKMRESYWESARQVGWDIEVFDEKAKHTVKSTVAEVKKWSDLVKDPKFQDAWRNLFKIDFGGASPLDTLKQQMEAAKVLVKSFKGDTSEVERFFQQMISEAEAEWKSFVDKEQQIFDERLSPAERLENEKQDWIKIADKWGMDATTIVKYYDQKIQEELQKVADEAVQKQKEAEEKAIQELDNFMSEVENALSTQERLHELFNPLYMTDTASGDIEQEMDNLQQLYDTQMQYLNGLLETADLTEEAYAAVESRILSLTVAFNSQMNNLKKEQDYQGKNWALLSRKGVASFQLMENAAADFSATFQALGLENSIAYKGFASAQAIISSLLAANRVLAEEPGEMWIKIAAAAATLAAGLANVYSIWAVSPDGSNAGSMAGSVGMSATPVIGNSQPINYTRNITTAEEQDEMNAPIYVTVTDIEDGINGRRAQVTNSSF